MSKMYDRREDEFYDFDDFGVDEDTYDDEKLDRVLDEIEEIKHTIQGLPVSDYDMDGGYDEVTKLRDEVEFSRTTQNLRREIQRLSNRISDLQDEQVGRERSVEAGLAKSIDKLVRTGEEQLRKTAETEARLSEEMAVLKKQLYKLSSVSDVVSAVNSLKNDVKNAEEFIVNISNTVDALVATSGDNANGGGELTTELLRQIYDLKSLIGAPSPLTARRTDELLDIYNMLARVKYDAKLKTITVVDKFASIDALAKRLNDTNESDIQPIVDSLNAIIDELGSQPLTRAVADVIFEASSIPYLNVTATKREMVKSYLDTVATLVKDGVVDNMDDLPDVIALKNNVQGNRNEFECESVYSAVLNTNIALLSEKDSARQKVLRTQLKQQINQLVSLEVRDLISYSPVTLVKAYRAPKTTEGEGLFDKVSELRSYLLDANIAQSGGVISEQAGSGLVSEINSLKNEIYRINSMDNVSQAILDLKGDCLTILEKLEQQQAGGTADADLIAGIPTINEIVSQLDRLFDDIKNLVTDSENNVMSSVEVIGEAIKNLTEETRSAKADRERLVADVAEIKARLEKFEAPVAVEAAEAPVTTEAPTAIETPSINEAAVEELHARLDAIEANQQVILDAIEKLTTALPIAAAPVATAIESKDDEILAEIKLLRDQIFAISIANVGEGDEVEYESYNSLILSEVCDVADKLAEIEESIASENANDNSEKIEAELASLKADLTAALEKSGDSEAVIAELNKIKEEFAKRPEPAVVEEEKPVVKKTAPQKKAKKAPAPITLPTKKRKSVSPVSGGGAVTDLLKKIGKTDIVIDEE